MGSALLSSTPLEWVAAMNSTIEPRWNYRGRRWLIGGWLADNFIFLVRLAR